MPKKIQTVRGMTDILPRQQVFFERVFQAFRTTARAFGFEQIETPLVEEAALFARAIGEGSEIVTKQMFSVSRLASGNPKGAGSSDDTAKQALVLRPEATASVVRAYIEHGMHTWPQPVKLSYIGPMFRYERPQAGRLRQFWQAGVEIIGEGDASIDALTMLVGWQTLEKLGLGEQLIISVNSVGDRACRSRIRKQLAAHFEKHASELCEDCKGRLKTNPLRILDCKQDSCRKIAESAPELIDLLCEECRAHFRMTLEYLDELGLPYELSQRLVRGLDYYTRTVFEIGALNDEARQSSLLGGGRYDTLIEEYGGGPTPASGFAIGVERVVELIKTKKIPSVQPNAPQVFLIQLSEGARKAALRVARTLTKNDIQVSSGMTKGSLKAQLRSADRSKAPLSLIIGQREAFDATAIVREMDDGSQETVAQSAILETIHKRLSQK